MLIIQQSEWTAFFDRHGLEKIEVFEVYDGPLRAILPSWKEFQPLRFR